MTPKSSAVCASRDNNACFVWSRELDVAVDLESEVDPAERDHGLGRQFFATLQAAIRTASRTACSISRCAVTPSFLRNLRTLVLRASSSMVVLHGN
jgi:hypothetical protein